MAAGFYSRPSSSLGYWRGGGSESPLTGGQGSNMGLSMQGLGKFSAGTGGDNGGWHPTVLYLIGLVIVEMIVFGFISRALR